MPVHIDSNHFKPTHPPEEVQSHISTAARKIIINLSAIHNAPEDMIHQVLKNGSAERGLVRRNAIIIRNEKPIMRNHTQSKDNVDISKRQAAGDWKPAVTDMMSKFDLNHKTRLQNASVYKNEGILQTKVENIQQLIFVSGVPHKVVFKQSELERTALSKFTQQQIERGVPLDSINVLSGVGIDNDAILSIEKLSGWYDFVVLPSDPMSLFLNQNKDSTFGHTSLTQGKSVILAGEIFFGKTSDGTPKIEQWTNKSGHYMVGSHLEKRAILERNPLLKSQDAQREYILSRVPTNEGLPLLPPELLDLWNGEI